MSSVFLVSIPKNPLIYSHVIPLSIAVFNLKPNGDKAIWADSMPLHMLA